MSAYVRQHGRDQRRERRRGRYLHISKPLTYMTVIPGQPPQCVVAPIPGSTAVRQGGGYVSQRGREFGPYIVMPEGEGS